ncbi:MAG: nuclear transport factor 2 family protein [Terriglobales bacterium]
MVKFIVAALFILGAMALAQDSRPAQSAALQKELIEIEQRVAEANNTCDYGYFRRIEANEFIFTDSRGGVTTREQDLAGEKDCKPHNDSHDFDDVRVLPFSGGAVLNARHTVSGERNGKPFRVQMRFTDVFVWRDGRWQMIAGHSSRIPANP